MANTGNDYQAARKDLFDSAMKGEWDEVKNIYKSKPCVQKEKITRSGRTALHIAVSDSQEATVEELVRIICETAQIEAFRIQDERGNTLLHTAAALGSLRMCDCIARSDQKHSSLIAARNHDGETPLFLAALHGHRDAFLLLHSLCGVETGYSYSRRHDGDTILHCAISGDYFDLAFQIIHLYPNLVNTHNERGQSPLHLLATKPSAFRSGSHLGCFKRIIYHCIFVDELQEVPENKIPELLKLKSTDRKNTDKGHPKNYETCCTFISLLKDMVNAATSRGSADNPRSSKGNDGAHPVRNIAISGGSEEQGKNITDTENPPSSEGKRSAVGPDEKPKDGDDKKQQLFPRNNTTIFEFVKLVSKGMLIILGLGSNEMEKIREKKQKHTWSIQILDKLLQLASTYEYENDGTEPQQETTLRGGRFIDRPDIVEKEDKETTGENPTKEVKKEDEKTTILLAVKNINGSTHIIQKLQEQFPMVIHDTNTQKRMLLAVENMQAITAEMKKETPILVAAKNGITEIVDKILKRNPVAIHDTNSEKKNIVLLAVENRQPHVYDLLLQTTTMKDSVFRKVDNKGNSALHLAATLGEYKPWLIPGAALQMQWELKWYEYVKDSMPFHFFVRHNKENKVPREILTETHKDLLKAGGEWLTNTSESCSVVAALIATVAFTTSATVPGGVKADSGTPTLKDEPAFNLFAISSLVALCFSVTAVVMFLSILTSRYQEKDFAKSLPRKLLVGLTSLFVSVRGCLKVVRYRTNSDAEIRKQNGRRKGLPGGRRPYFKAS